VACVLVGDPPTLKSQEGAADLTRLAAPTRITATIFALVAIGTSVAACGSSSPSRSASVAAACRASGRFDQTHTTSAHVFLLHLSPRESMLMLTPAEAKAKHITTGELMVGGKMSMETSSGTMSGGMTTRHLEIHICRRASGTVVTDARPSITVSPPPGGGNGQIPVAVMEGVTAGVADQHYGNNVALRRGATYTITVRVGNDSASFKATVPRSA